MKGCVGVANKAMTSFDGVSARFDTGELWPSATSTAFFKSPEILQGLSEGRSRLRRASSAACFTPAAQSPSVTTNHNPQNPAASTAHPGRFRTTSETIAIRRRHHRT
jgi:hypothetical protein